MKKIKWKNVMKLIVLIFCISLVIHDVYMVTVHGWITGNLQGWSWFGFLTFLIALITAIVILDEFIEQIKSTPTSHQTFRKGTNRK